MESRPAHLAPPLVRFGEFALDLSSRELRRNGRRVHVAEKPFRVLEALLESPGEVVERDALRRRLWGDDTFVDFDNNLNTAVASLREALGDAARAPRWIETLPRRGYRFVGALEPPARPATASRWLPSAAALSVLAASLAWVAPPDPPHARRSPPAAPMTSLAYEDGIYLLKRGDPESLERAIVRLDAAVAERPDHAPAAAALGEAWLRSALRAPGPGAAPFDRAEGWARRALELDPFLATPRRTLSGVHLHRDWDLDAASREIAAAVEADPSDPESHLVAATVSAARGRHDDALRSARRAVSLDPGDMRVRADLAFFLLAAGRAAEAADESRRVLELSPDFAPALDFLLSASERLGRHDDARSAALRLMDLAAAPEEERALVEGAEPRQVPRRYRRWQVRRLEASPGRWTPTAMASVYASAGERARALECLERAYESRDAMLALMLAQPDLATVRGDPRFTAIARRVGVPLRGAGSLENLPDRGSP